MEETVKPVDSPATEAELKRKIEKATERILMEDAGLLQRLADTPCPPQSPDSKA